MIFTFGSHNVTSTQRAGVGHGRPTPKSGPPREQEGKNEHNHGKKRVVSVSAAAVAGLTMLTGFAGTSSAATAPMVPASAFNFNKTFSTMSALKAITAAGTGKVAFLLPDTQSSSVGSTSTPRT